MSDEEKCIIQIVVDKKLREIIKDTAKKSDRSLSSYIRLLILKELKRDTGIDYKN
jgi:predicted GTPase